ncbi:hypothetical protein, partial [Burkholderia sp. Ap-962]|uniref:hypothetical protein n=1 Tax=Burkholderia sp. Ap-962 TaxID=2608333 RepID=UPI001963D71B
MASVMGFYGYERNWKDYVCMVTVKCNDSRDAAKPGHSARMCPRFGAGTLGAWAGSSVEAREAGMEGLEAVAGRASPVVPGAGREALAG